MTSVERIDAMLKERKMSRRQLAIRANIPPSTLQSAMERNKTLSYEMQEKIAKVLDIHIFQLLGDNEREIYFQGEFDTKTIILGEYYQKGYEFTAQERCLVNLFHRLNDCGKETAVERIWELTEIPSYRRQDAPEPPAGTNTTPPPDAPEPPLSST